MELCGLWPSRVTSAQQMQASTKIWFRFPRRTPAMTFRAAGQAVRGGAWAAESGPRAGCSAAGCSAVPAATSGLTSTRMWSSTAMRPAVASTHAVLSAECSVEADVHIIRCNASECPHGAANRRRSGEPLQQCSVGFAGPSCIGRVSCGPMAGSFQAGNGAGGWAGGRRTAGSLGKGQPRGELRGANAGAPDAGAEGDLLAALQRTGAVCATSAWCCCVFLGSATLAGQRAAFGGPSGTPDRRSVPPSAPVPEVCPPEASSQIWQRSAW